MLELEKKDGDLNDGNISSATTFTIVLERSEAHKC